ncbi:hypothetical protein LOY97_002402 [Ophidiomyces ophidiicola]|nr:hypothetical protein LOZ40_003943 [Ophidiomyces ophidiicola]KAI2460352.1 hypothetical protein LOY97_002402 [Ophidiomyces ophidiicola]
MHTTWASTTSHPLVLPQDIPLLQDSLSISSARHSETRSTPAVNSAAESQSTIESLKSLNTLIRQISLDLCPQEEAVTSLGNWLKTISPEEYTQIPQWTPEMWAAYNDYKAKAEEQGRAHKAYLAFSASHPKPSDPDENLERARAAEARLSFLGEYQNAFENKVSIQNHIEEASKQIVSGRNAIKKARRSHNDLWNKNPGKANPEVFDDVI